MSLVTWDEGQPTNARIDGVQILPVCRRNAGLRGLRFLHPRWSSLCRALRAAQADVCYHNSAEEVTGQVVWWCRRHATPFVYAVASNPDCDARLPQMPKFHERAFYRYGLRHADEVIVQTRRQRDMLAAGFGRRSRVIPMPCPGPVNGQYVVPNPPPPGHARVAWVGRIVPVKRLEWLLDLAGSRLDVGFDIVGAAEDSRYARALTARAARLPNVILHGRVERNRMPEVYRRASCLCCTSAFEGFPNTFLEAFSHGLPVVSTVDPDGVLATHGLGAAAPDVPALLNALRDLLTNEARWRAASGRARQYYLENHTVDSVLPQFEQVFLDVIAQRRSSGSHA